MTAPTAELVVVPDGADTSVLEAIEGLTLVRYDDRSETGAVPIARGLRAVPPRRVFAVGRARGLGSALPGDGLYAVAWAVRASLLPDRANPDPLLTRVLAEEVGAEEVGAVATTRWLGDSDVARAEAARLAELTGAAVENPACFSLLAACARLDVPAAVLLGTDTGAATAALASFLESERGGVLLA